MNTIEVGLHSAAYLSPTIKVSITNKSPNACYEVPSQAFTEKTLVGNNFRVTNDKNERVPYIGPQIDRVPTYVALLPGETKSADVQLDDLYELSAGHYVVQYKAITSYRDCSNPASNYRGVLESNSIDIKV